jgi:hypothetical protein
MDAVTREVDLESFTRWFIGIVWCAVTDPFQGLILRDNTRPDARWFIVNWDMDHAFQDLYQQAPKNAPWKHDTFRTLQRQRDIRAELVMRLLREDPSYREYFKERLVEVVNHQLTDEFLQERFDYYARMTDLLRVPHRNYLPILQQFLDLRTAEVMRLAPGYVGASEAYRYTLNATEGTSVRINGHDVGAAFTGWYFRDMPVRIEAVQAPAHVFAYWVVNGERLVNSGPVLSLPATRHAAIEAVFRSTT